MLILAILLTSCLSHLALASTPDQAQDGLIDLRSANTDQSAVELKGQWDFFWNTFSTDTKLSPERIQVPSSWAMQYDYPARGHAVYRLKIQLPAKDNLAIRFFPIWTSARIYFNDRLIDEIGRVDSELANYIPAIRDRIHVIEPGTRELNLRIEVASHEFYFAGITAAPKLASLDLLRRERELGLATSILLIGITIIMGIYHLCLYALRTRERSTLYFGILCITVSLYVSASNEGALILLFPNIDYEVAIRIFNAWELGLACVILFTYEIFPKLYSKKFAYISSALALSYFIYIHFADARDYVPTAIIVQLLAVIYSFYTSYVVIRAIKQKQEGAYLFFVGCAVFVLSSIHDMMLTNGLFDSYPIASLGMVSFILSQSFLLAKKFSSAFERVEISEKEIRGLSEDLKKERDQVLELNTNLEQIVDEKTREIRSIMTHIKLGIFAITGNRYSIHKDYSEHLKELFSKEELEGENALDLLFHDSSLSTDERAQVQGALDMSLGEDELNFETNSHCLPLEFRKDKNIIELTWNPITNESGIVEKILVTIRDVTEIRALQLEAQDKQEELMFIGELLNVSAESFRRFIQSCRDFIAENRKLINSKSLEKKDMETLKVLFINMHTMKGAARSLYFKKMTKIFHDVEQHYAVLQKDLSANWDKTQLHADLDEVVAILDVYEQINRDKLGRNTSSERRIELAESDLKNVYQLLEGLSESNKLAQDIQAKIFPEIFTSCESVLEDICSALPTLARDLEKENPKTIIEAQGLYINSQGEDLLRKIFVHLIRNSMDHGIETPELRKKHGKDPVGCVRILMSRNADSSIRVEFGDDGGGLHIEKIKEIAIKSKIIKESESISLEEEAELIFNSGLSTASSVSDVSGRGVGMDAIRSYLSRHNASIEIQLKSLSPNALGRYDFQFVMHLPGSLFVEVVSKAQAA